MSDAVRRGRRLGDFVVGERIGRGGFAEVYQASQPSLGRTAVIKVLRGAPAAHQIQRFELEARMACQLDHPYAAHVYAFGVESDSLMWIAMELVRGVSLAQWVETKGPIPLGRFCGLFERLCEVVDAAHQAGLIHRDIKPGNVMVVTRAGKLMPKLLDFGIATNVAYPTPNKPLPAAALPTFGDDSEEVEESTEPTRSGAEPTSGTPAYMAPEQWHRARHDHRVDIYALGVLAYRCLTGRAPFVGRTPQQLYLAHHQQPVPSLGEGFAAELDEVLGKALAKDPDARYRSALELAAAFGRAARRDEPYLPRDEVRRWLATAPNHLAACVSAVASAHSLSEALEASRQLCDALAQWLGILALAGTVSVGARPPDIAELRTLRHEALTTRDWLTLASALCSPYAKSDEDFPCPEMIHWFFDDAGPETILAALAATRIGAASGFPRDLMVRVVQGLRFVAGYSLLAGGREWTAATHGTVASGDSVFVSDGDRNPLFEVSPLVSVAAPAPGEPPELFAITGGGRTNARQLGYPHGFERECEDVWPWFETHFIVAAEDRERTIADRSPYRGLAPFETTDADLYFGRARVVEQLFNRVLSQPFVALTGPSGSGKSSLVFAGLIPRLSDGWITVTMRPGRTPVATLDAALQDEGLPGFDDAATIVSWLRERGLRLLLVIDQGEELLTLAGEHDRSRVAATLANLVGGDRVRVVVTLRHDFIARADELPQWRELIQHNLLLVSVPDRDELTEMVVSPAMFVGYDFDDPLLVPDMVAEVADRPGALPLLSFAASRLWDARDVHARQLTRAAYNAMGGVGGALARYAEDMFASLTPRQHTLVRELLRRLITAEGTSAPAPRHELATIGEGADVVIEALVAARILVATERGDGAEDVAIVHEALIDRWERLARWRREDAAGARYLDELRAAAALWGERGRDESYLWRGEMLATFRQWQPRWTGSLTAGEAAFGKASLQAEARIRRRRRASISIAIATLTAAVISLVLLYRRADHSRDDAERRFTDMLLDRGRSELLAERPLHALVYLSAAYERGRDGPGVRVALGMAARALDREKFRAHPYHSATMIDQADDGFVLSSALGEPARSWQLHGPRLDAVATYNRPDGLDDVEFDLGLGGKTIGSSGFHKPLMVWDRTGKQRATGKDPGQVYVVARLSVGPDKIATTWESEIALWDTDAQWLGTLKNPNRPKDAEATKVVSFRFARNAPLVLVTYRTGYLEVWRTSDLALVWQLDLHEPVFSCSFAGDRVVAYMDSGSFTVVSPSGEIEYRRQAHSKLWGADTEGTKIATVGMENQIKLWNVADGNQDATLTERSMQPDMVKMTTDSRLLVAIHDSQAAIWNVQTRTRLGLVDAGRPISSVLLSRDGQTLITADVAGWIKLWDMRPDYIQTVFTEQHAEVFSTAFQPDGDIVSTFAGDGTIRQWDTQTGRVTGVLTLPYDSLTTPSLQRIAYLSDNRLLAPYRSHMTLWDLKRGVEIGMLPTYFSNVTVSVGPNDSVGVTNAIPMPGYELTVWDAAKQSLVAHHTLDEVAIDIGFDASGKLMAFVGWKHVGVWDIQADKILWKADVPNPNAADLDVSHNGLLTTSAEDGYVRIWNMRSGTLIRTIKQPARALSVAFSPDGTLLATANADHTVYLWDVETGDLAGPLVGHTSVINGLAFSPDGTKLISVSRDQHTLVWSIPYEHRTPAELAKLIAERVPFRLAGAELVENEHERDQP